MFSEAPTNIFGNTTGTLVKSDESGFTPFDNIMPERFNSISEPKDFPQSKIGKEITSEETDKILVEHSS